KEKRKRKRETEAFSALKPQKEKEALEPKCFVFCRNFTFSSESQIWGFEAHFLHQAKSWCLFLNGTQRVRYLERYFYDRQEYFRFDSDLGKFVAVTEFGKVDADHWNRDEQWMQGMKAAVDRFCRNNYEIANYEAAKREERMIGRRSESWGGGASSRGGGRDPFPSWPSLGILLP
ncbi:putative MHC class II antigen protein, partial [Naja naja]